MSGGEAGGEAQLTKLAGGPAWGAASGSGGRAGDRLRRGSQQSQLQPIQTRRQPSHAVQPQHANKPLKRAQDRALLEPEISAPKDMSELSPVNL